MNSGLPNYNFSVLFRQVKEKYNLQDEEMAELILRLREEGMIRAHPGDALLYTLPFKGRDWISPEIGGYSGERKRVNRSSRFNKYVNVFLIVGSVATAVIAFSEILK
jgi:hypothetical protein